MKIKTAAYSYKGIRELNEDSFIIGKQMNECGAAETVASDDDADCSFCIMAVADGMGGNEAGEKASAFVVNRLIAISNNADKNHIRYTADEFSGQILSVHRELLETAKKSGSATMGTTLSGIVVQDGKFGIYNVGDSRVYRLRNGFMQQLTHDDSLRNIMPGAASNIITNAMGAGLDNIEIAVRFSDTLGVGGDCFLICSDGVHGHVEDDDLEQLLSGNFSLIEKSRQIVNKAIDGGSDDNCTAVLVQLEE